MEPESVIKETNISSLNESEDKVVSTNNGELESTTESEAATVTGTGANINDEDNSSTAERTEVVDSNINDTMDKGTKDSESKKQDQQIADDPVNPLSVEEESPPKSESQPNPAVTDEDDAEVAAIESNMGRLRISSKLEGKDKKKKHEGNGKCVKGNPMGLFTKVVFRNLPPSLSEEEFLQVINPIPEEYDYFNYKYADKFYGVEAAATAHVNFLDPDNAELFIQRFHSYIIVDHSGYEFPISVEFAINQNVPVRSTKPDPLSGTLADDEEYKKFCQAYEENDNMDTEGFLGVKPEFSDVKSMQDQFMKDLEEKESRKGELKSTPLVNAIHEKLKNDKEKQIQEREERARARRKEQDRLRNLRKERRREKREQERRERKERQEKERKERDKRRKEKEAAAKLSKEKKIESKDSSKVQTKPESTMKDASAEGSKKSQVDNNSATNVEKKDGGASRRKDVPESSRRSEQKGYTWNSRKDRYANDDNSRKPYSGNKRRDFVDERKQSDRPSQRKEYQREAPVHRNYYHDQADSNTKAKELKEVNKSVKADSKAGSSKDESEGTKSAESINQSENPKKKVVKKIVKVVRVKSGDSVPGEAKVEKKVTKNTDEVSAAPKKEPTEAVKSSSSKESVSTSRSTVSDRDRPRRGRPDIQIYRPGSWRNRGKNNNEGNDNNSKKPEASGSTKSAAVDQGSSLDAKPKESEPKN